MKLLLDWHVLLWYDTSAFLSQAVRAEMDGAEALLLSVASVWELTLKRSLGKLDLRAPVIQIAEGCGAELLSITPAHAQLAGELPLHHRDPFDRMLVAQAMVEGLSLATHDRTLQQYGVPLLLA